MKKSWRTTLTGCGAAAANTILQLVMTGQVDPQTLLVSGALAAIGLLAKDFNVSGT